MDSSTSTTWISVSATAITVLGTVMVAFLNRQNKPLKDVMKRTKIDGEGGLVEALGVLQTQLKEEQVRYDKQIQDTQHRHQQEIAYYVDQLRLARQEIQILREEKDLEISLLRKKLDDHERRLNKGHVGK